MASKLGEAYLELSVRMNRFKRSVGEAQSYFITRWKALQARATLAPKVNISKLRAGINSAVTQYKRLQAARGEAISGMGIGGLAAIASLTAALYKLASVFSSVISEGIKVAGTLIQQQVVIEQLAGSASAASAILKDLVDLDIKTPFNVGELTKVATMLMATGEIAKKDILPMVRAITDAAAGSAGGLESLPAIARAFAQMLSKGKIQAQEMTVQLANAGIPAWKLLADAMGLSVAEVQKLGEEGKLGLKEVHLLLGAVTEKYKGLAEEITNRSPFAAFQAMRSQISLIIAQVAGPLLDAFLKFVNLIREGLKSDIMKKVVAGATQLASVVAKVFEFLTTTRIGQAITAVALLAAGFTAAAVAVIGLIAAGFAFPQLAIAIAAIPAIIAILLPIMIALAAAIVGVAAAFRAAFEAPEAVRLRRQLSEIKKLILEIAKNVMGGLIAAFNAMKAIVMSMFGPAAKQANIDFWTSITEKIREVLDIISLLSTNFSATWELIKIGAEMAFNTIVARVKHFMAYWGTVIQNIGTIMVNGFGAAFDELAGFATAFGTYFMEVMESAFDFIKKGAAAPMKFLSDVREHGIKKATENYFSDFQVAIEVQFAAQKASFGKFGAALNPVAAGNRIGKRLGDNLQDLPGFKPPAANKALAQRAGNIIAQLQKERTQKRVDEAKQKAKKLLEDAIRGAGASVKGAAAGAVDMAGGAARGVAGMFRGKEEEKKAKAEFVGIADLSKKIQLGILNSEEEKDRKAMVKGIDVVGKGVKGVKDGVRDVYNAVKDWIPKAS